jgi:hypothetical protein
MLQPQPIRPRDSAGIEIGADRVGRAGCPRQGYLEVTPPVGVPSNQGLLMVGIL